MTEQGDPLARRQPYLSHPVEPRRKKLAPDPDVRRAIVEAAAKSVREQGVRGLSVAAVLERAHLSTRAFYRHFDSKDQLVAAVFLEMTRTEVRRLRTRMEQATNPIEAVAAWIDGRLDLAFDEDIKAELRQISLEAQSKVFSTPETVTPAYGAILEPLVEQLERGRWCAAGMVEAGKQFRRVNGHLHLPTFRTALERQTAEPVGPVVHNDEVSAA